MVDFDKLRTQKKKTKPIEPGEIFRRLPKPPGINDLYQSQAEVLESWFKRRNERDVVLKLHTGGGKTLVGLLMAQSTLNENGGPVLYLAPTVQLVNQTLDKARAHGIPAVAYQTGKPLHDDFVNSKAIMVGTYKALFNGRSKFGVRGTSAPQNVSAIILDDAHVAFSVVRESFTLEIDAEENREQYEALTNLYRRAFRDLDRGGTFDDVVSGMDYAVLEVPYWAWREKLDAAQELLRASADDYALIWPLLRDQLHLCHALISKNAFTITSILPLVNQFPTFADARRRIYMSATIADDSEIARTFDADPQSISAPLASRSLAGVSERMILIPDLMKFKFDVRDAVSRLLQWTVKQDVGAIVLVPSKKAAEDWSKDATFGSTSSQVESLISSLQSGSTRGPVVFANRYDGIDLPGDACRLLVMSGLPSGTSDYELFRAGILHDGGTITRMLAQRIEQGIGRGARGAGDYCVVLLVGSRLAGWIAKETNFNFFTSATRAQLEMGMEISKEVEDSKDLAITIARSFKRDKGWTKYHAETLAELVDEEQAENVEHEIAFAERKAFNLWHDGYHEKAIARIERALAQLPKLDAQIKGWMQQLAARIADRWGNKERAEDFQRQAFANNRNLVRPKVLPPYRPLPTPGPQERKIVQIIGGYRMRQGFLQSFEDTVAYLHKGSTANQFEQALMDLGIMIGLTAERHDERGQGPDVLWLLPHKIGFVIEAKSRKKAKNALTKEEHGQLLVAEEWFEKNYKEYECVRVSVHPKPSATKAAVAGASHALTYENLARLVSDARALLTTLCESQLSEEELLAETARLLATSDLRANRLSKAYLSQFEEME